MRKNFQDWARENNITLDPSNQASLLEANTKYVAYVADQIGGVSADVQAKMQEMFKPVTDNIAQIEAALKAQGTELQKLKDGATAKTDDAPAGLFTKENLEGIKSVMRDGKGSFEVVSKAVTTRASVANNGLALDLTEIGQLASRRNSFYEFLAANGRIRPVPQSANGTVRYIDWDEATKVRAASMTAEGNASPESTAAWQTYTVSLRKIADTLPWTDEFEYDNAFLVNELQQFLTVNLALIRNSQLINGDNTGQNLAGMITVCPTYTPVAAGIVDASVYDLFVKLRQTIEAQRGGKYTTNFALMNINDINKYKLKKDGENNYIMPPFYDTARNRIDGVTVIEDNAVTANTMFIGDINYCFLHAANGVVAETGYINDDFTKGQKRLRIYERLLFLIRAVDRTGFLKVTDIDAALTTLAS